MRFRVRNILLAAALLLAFIVLLSIRGRSSGQAASNDSPVIQSLDNVFDGVESGLQRLTADSVAMSQTACPDPDDTACVNFVDALTRAAGLWKHRTVILALVDEGYLDVALNFYELSILPHGLKKHVLFAALSQTTCDVLEEYEISCYAYADLEMGKQFHGYETETFQQKLHFRADIILRALRARFTILHTDLDVIFQENPLPYLTCADCDMEALVDEYDTLLDPGFVLFRPTEATINMYEMRVNMAENNPGTTDITALNCAVAKFAEQLKINRLDRTLFVTGSDYFEREHLYFGPNECEDCVVVHNNWVVSKKKKVPTATLR